MKIKRYLFIFSFFLLSVFCFNADVIADSYQPLQVALDAMVSDIEVTVTEVIVPEWEAGSNFYYAFEPTTTYNSIGFIIYPGGYVDPRSYAPFAHEIARNGFLTVIVKMIDDIALYSVERASKAISDYPGIEKWAIGGHSLGAVGACAYTKTHTENIDGVVLWAGYPSETFSLNNKIIKAISIYGTNDGLTTLDKIDDSKDDLPPYTQWVEIEGGNHTQFGWYGNSPNDYDFLQPEDNPASITRQEQQDIVVQATLDFLDYFNLCPNDLDNDYDNDAVCGDIDKCPFKPNGSCAGTCSAGTNLGEPCTIAGVNESECGTGGFCSMNQEDADGDCTGDVCDSDPNDPNIPVTLVDSDSDGIGDPCDNCPNTPNLGQEDTMPPEGNRCGDACECEGDFEPDGDVDGTDAVAFKNDFFRKDCAEPTPCNGDFECDGDVDGTDAVKFKADFFRKDCPSCTFSCY